MSPELAVTISLGLLAALAGATWFVTPKESDVARHRNLALSKCHEDEVTLELEFYERLNNFYAPPAPGVAEQYHKDMYGGLRELASHYVKQRETLWSSRDRIRTADTSIARLRQMLIGNFVFYVITVLALVVVPERANGHLGWWWFPVVWAIPWAGFVTLNWRQTQLLRLYRQP